MKAPGLEIACFNLESALIAGKAGADRIELCSGLAEGGTTPDAETIRLAQEQLNVELFVMIRPRGGDFTYSADEFALMKKSIAQIKKMNVNGFVFGILTKNGNVNKEQNRELLDLASPYPCTFHRAFDKAADPFIALEDLIALGFTTVLTSGQQTDAVDGMSILSGLVKQADGRITVMPGGGIRSSNISVLKQKINAEFFHSSAILEKEQADAAEIKLLKEKLLEKR